MVRGDRLAVERAFSSGALAVLVSVILERHHACLDTLSLSLTASAKYTDMPSASTLFA